MHELRSRDLLLDAILQVRGTARLSQSSVRIDVGKMRRKKRRYIVKQHRMCTFERVGVVEAYVNACTSALQYLQI